jgi:putative membrane protein
MLLVLCIDLDDDLGRKTDVETPVIGSGAVREAAVELATADPEDSDVNVLFEGLHLRRQVTDEEVVVAAVAGENRGDVAANRAVGDEIDTVLASLSPDDEVRALIVTDGAQDESVLPVIRSRITVDGVRRVVVRQAQDLESMYYTMKQVLDDPETRGTILVPLGILLLIYPLAVLGSYFEVTVGEVLGTVSGLLGLYVLARAIGVVEWMDDFVDRTRRSLYAGRVTLIAYVVAFALLVIGAVSGADALEAVESTTAGRLSVLEVLGGLLYGAVRWFTAAGVTTSLGQITDEYLADRLEWRYLNAPFYVLSIGTVLHGVSAYFLDIWSLQALAAALTLGTLLGLSSTLAFAVAEARSVGDREEATA